MKDFLIDASIDTGQVRVGVVTYSTDVHIQFYLNTHKSKQAILDAIDNIPYTYGSTNTYGGLSTMHKQMFTAARGDRPGVRNIAVLVTDGVSNLNTYQTIPAARASRADGIHIYAIGIGLADTSELRDIASEPASENSFSVQEFSALEGMKHRIFERLCPGKFKHGKAQLAENKPPPPRSLSFSQKSFFIDLLFSDMLNDQLFS